MDSDETHVDSAAEGDLPTITHTGGMDILDENLPKPATDSRHLYGAVPDEVSASVAETFCQDPPLPVIQSYSLEALTLPPSTGTQGAPFKVPDIIGPKHAGNRSETSPSSVPTPESEFSCADLSRNTSSETNATDLESPDAATHTPFAR